MIGRDYHSIIKYDALFFSRIVKPFDIEIAQTWVHLIKHLEIIQEFDVKLFIELGVFKGGLASVFLSRMEYVTDFSYFGIDKTDEYIDPRIRAKVEQSDKASFLWGNVFDTTVIETVKNAIVRCPGTAYVLCDNGDKPKEIKLYHKILRRGDLISIHDYNKSAEFVNDELLNSLPTDLEEVDPQRFRKHADLPVFRKV